jgi:UDP-N-acetylmuramoyl-L-alanyl-D-glutamate--2,6-diaminopimelate ligase
MVDKILGVIKKILPKKMHLWLAPIYHYCMGLTANIIYKFPSHKLIVIGVTGTTGKTTSVYLIAKTLAAAGYKVGYTSTAMFCDGDKEWLNNKKMTMVGRLFTQQMLNRMVKNGCQYAIVETSSEGILQYRHRFINYDVLVFTSLYPEHIEAHGNFENYKEAKGMLFAHLRDCRTKYVDEQRLVHKTETGIKKLQYNRVKKMIIVNGDDLHCEYFLNFWAEEKMKYKVQTEPQVKGTETKENPYYHKIIASGLEIEGDGTSFYLDGQHIKLNLLGSFSAYNAMNAACVALSQAMSVDKIKQGLESVQGIPGRMERIDEKQNFTVIVDYAFEPKAVEKLYETIKLIPHQKVIHVLGSAGGGRDMSRRPILGQLAGQRADYVIITNEDPYDDDPQIIIDQVSIGAEKGGKEEGKNLFRIMDRREAIHKALSLAQTDDIVLITGKGSEQAIVVKNNEKLPWDDREVVREELKQIRRQ